MPSCRGCSDSIRWQDEDNGRNDKPNGSEAPDPSFRVLATLLLLAPGARHGASGLGRTRALGGDGLRCTDVFETGWEDVLIESVGADFIDVYLVAGALARQYAQYKQGALSLEAEGQVARYFGDQDHWEFNAVPVVGRWSRFPWNGRLRTTAAFGLGLSYATELPPVEVALEGGSKQLLVYWVLEVTAGAAQAPWSISLRLHHRSGPGASWPTTAA